MATSKVQRFGPYVILDRIGDGGMAEIFLAKVQGYSGFEKLVALKKIHPRYSQNQTFAQMLIHEAKLAASLQHFNVVQVLDLGEIDDQVFIAMEYVRGRDLAAVLSNTYRRKEKLPLNLSLCIATEFMTGLDYAHRMGSTSGTPLGIIHRDISPQNVIISYEGEVKVTDFGIARVISEKEGEGFKLPGNLHGKFGYMSPEQVAGQEIDQRSDIFSAGVVLWEMLTGQRLFRAKEHKDTIRLIASGTIPAPSEINDAVPPSVDRICFKALARDPAQRYQTMGGLLGELSRAADALPRRAGSRDLSVYMRRQFGTPTGGYAPTRSSKSERSDSNHSGFAIGTTGVSQVSGFSLTSGERRPLGQILMEQGGLSKGDLEIVLAEQRARGGRIGELLVASGTISEGDLVRALATQSGLASIAESDLLALPAPSKLLKRFPREAAVTSLVLPFSVNEEERSVSLAVSDPYDDKGVLEAKVVLGVSDVVVFLATRGAIRAAIDAWYRREEEPAEPAPDPIFVEESPSPEGPPVVLVADGDPDMIRELVSRIQEEACEVLTAYDGKRGRDLIREKRPQVAILDAGLPGIDGYNLLLEIRSKNQDAAVFITSARGDEFRQAKALELGADDFFVKPFSLELTTSKVRREIHKRTGGRRALVPAVTFDGVSGSLKDMTALDIVQSLEIGRKSAHVVLQYEDGRGGTLGVHRGDVRGSEAGKLVGEEAFYLLMRGGAGLFRIEYRDSPTQENISKPNTYLMIESMRRLDEGDDEEEDARASHAPFGEIPTQIAPPIPAARAMVETPSPVPAVARPSPPRVELERRLPPPPPPPPIAERRVASPPPSKSEGFAALAGDLLLALPAADPVAAVEEMAAMIEEDAVDEPAGAVALDDELSIPWAEHMAATDGAPAFEELSGIALDLDAPPSAPPEEDIEDSSKRRLARVPLRRITSIVGKPLREGKRPAPTSPFHRDKSPVE